MKRNASIASEYIIWYIAVFYITFIRTVLTQYTRSKNFKAQAYSAMDGYGDSKKKAESEYIREDRSQCTQSTKEKTALDLLL